MTNLIEKRLEQEDIDIINQYTNNLQARVTNQVGHSSISGNVVAEGGQISLGASLGAIID